MTSAAPGGARELTPQRLRVLAISLLVLLALTVWRLGSDPDEARDGPVEFSGETMGTTWQVSLDHALDEAARAAALARIELALDGVDSLMSTWRSDSELTALNEAPSTTPVPVSAETLEVLRIAWSVSDATEGAFDVTVGPLVAAWGFGADGEGPEPPEPAALAEVRERVGYTQVTIDWNGSTVTRGTDGLRIDLSAIAKGYAVDRVAEAVEALGYDRHLVEVGGELRSGAAKGDGSPWRIAVETPDPATRSVWGVLESVGEGVATSGDYRNFYEVDGVRYAHLIDPRTGRPVTHSGVSVTVVDPRATVADAWATALSVLGPDEGYEVAESRDLAALFVWQNGETFESRATQRMQTRVDRIPHVNSTGGGS